MVDTLRNLSNSMARMQTQLSLLTPGSAGSEGTPPGLSSSLAAGSTVSTPREPFVPTPESYAVAEMKKVFDHPVQGQEAVKRLLDLRQGSQSVAAYSVRLPASWLQHQATFWHPAQKPRLTNKRGVLVLVSRTPSLPPPLHLDTSKQLTVPGILLLRQSSLPLSALIDSGADDNFIDAELASQANLTFEPLATPKIVNALDGRLLASVTHQTYSSNLVVVSRKPSLKHSLC
ncbi:hypothetical protein L3Q82_015383 [Scortum barcoo]|uniref:Uncharacterized protein n=1 Tax=Scortum barcoo TaxID=214431 RepID=A0ACB8VU11_9TELE|nr:hypothetical protein L3Q82_015383 [Scortum barcoo]